MEYHILQTIQTPDDLRALSDTQLDLLALEIRARLIEVTSVNGGHVASSLGAVEAILALHSVFDFSRDRLVFDVGHQSYAHKLITGRNDLFDTLRRAGGLCGFPRRDESIYDTHDSGHASDSLSIAAGLALTRDLNRTDERIVAFIGDASLGGGMAFEALNQIGHEGTDLTIVLNDNEMSISHNVGALSLYLAKARMSKPYTAARDGVEGTMERFGRPGRAMVNAGERLKGSFKKLVVPGMFFEDMGIRYIGPIDGHNMPALKDAFAVARQATGPVLVHIVTQKGHGYRPAEQKPDVFHGIGSFDPKTGELVKRAAHNPTFTQVFSQSLLYESVANPDIVAITAAMEEGTGLLHFKERFADRFFDVGIAEEHAVALAAGFALGGKLPVVAIYSTFLQRAYDQIMINVALQRQHVVFCIDRAGLVGEDGPTHNGMFDLAYLRAVPNMRILAPSGADELSDALHTALLLDDGPVAIRYARGEAWREVNVCPACVHVPQKLPLGRGKQLREGGDVSILALGRLVHNALQAAELLAAQGIEAAVWDMRWAKPIDTRAVAQAAHTRLIVTLEEGTLNGGFGDAVLEVLAAGGGFDHTPVERIGLPDCFIAHGSIDQLFTNLGLTAQALAERISKTLDGSGDGQATA